MTTKPCPPAIRGSGRTQWMIDQLCDAVAEGQPKSRVWGHTMDFAWNHLRPLVMQGLQKRGLEITRVVKCRHLIEVEGSIIQFHSKKEEEYVTQGTRGFGEFVDHFADGEL